MCDELSENLNIYSKFDDLKGLLFLGMTFILGLFLEALVFKKCFLRNLWMKWYDFCALFLSN